MTAVPKKRRDAGGIKLKRGHATGSAVAVSVHWHTKKSFERVAVERDTHSGAAGQRFQIEQSQSAPVGGKFEPAQNPATAKRGVERVGADGVGRRKRLREADNGLARERNISFTRARRGGKNSRRRKRLQRTKTEDDVTDGLDIRIRHKSILVHIGEELEFRRKEIRSRPVHLQPNQIQHRDLSVAIQITEVSRDGKSNGRTKPDKSQHAKSNGREQRFGEKQNLLMRC